MTKVKYLLLTVVVLILTTGVGCISLGGETGTSGPAGMFVSKDKGESWQTISKIPTLEGVKDLSSASVFRIVFDPQDSKAFYWLSRDNGFFYSYDAGRTWQQPAGDLATGFVYGLAVNPTDKCTIYGTNGFRIMRTNDCMRSWVEVYRESRADTRLTALAYSPFAPRPILASESNGDLLQSYDAGVSWSVANRFGVYISNIIFDPFREGMIYAISRTNGIYRSEDNGKSWLSLANSLSEFPGALEFRSFMLHPKKEGMMYWVSTYGILVSDNRGDSWRSIDLITPPGSAQIYGFTVNPNNDKEIYYTATINSRSTLYKSVDGGKNWITRKLPSGQYPTFLYQYPEDANTLYLGYTIPPKK